MAIVSILRGLAGLALLTLAACASRGPVDEPQLSTETATRTFSVGYQQISERYIEPLTVGHLAMVGLSGLRVLDPTFDAEIEHGRLTYGSGGSRGHVIAAPAESDAEGWAAATVAVLKTEQRESRRIGAASIDRLYETVFDGALTLLDEHSHYASAQEALANRERRSGYAGIGVTLRNEAHGAAIVEVFLDSPAARVGLQPGDVITHLDNKPVVGANPINVEHALRGDVGSWVALRIERAGEAPFDISLVRQRVVTPTVYVTEDNGIITARVKGFNRRTTRQLQTLLNDQLAELGGRAKGLILDLRGNPGGLLNEGVSVADLFIPDGRIVATYGRHPASVHAYDAREDDIASGIPMVVLINGRSASASEIVAAALQDHERAIVIGSASYGKGTVQTVLPLPNEGELTITWSRFVTPSGYFLNGLGVPPSICTSAPAATAAQLIDRAVGDSARLINLFEEWRGIDRKSDADRKELKASCPTANAAGDVDNEVATSLLDDSRLYHRVLAFSPTLAAAEK